jgi:hypothetical protein
VVEIRQLSKNEQTEINFDERISSTPRSAQRCSSMVHALKPRAWKASTTAAISLSRTLTGAARALEEKRRDQIRFGFAAPRKCSLWSFPELYFQLATGHRAYVPEKRPDDRRGPPNGHCKFGFPGAPGLFFPPEYRKRPDGYGRKHAYYRGVIEHRCIVCARKPTMEDWLEILPPSGVRAVCSWERL